MSNQDPMLGDAATQDDYRSKIAAMMQEEAERTRQARIDDFQRTRSGRETEPVMLGNQGFTGGISSA